MKKLITISIILCLGLYANAQVSRFLEKGKSGIGISAFGEKADYFSGFGAQLGYTYKGKIDLSLRYSNEYYDEVKLGANNNDITSTFYTGQLTYWLFREQVIPEISANLGLTAGVESLTYTNYTYYDPSAFENTVEYKSWTEGSFGVLSCMNFKIKDSWFLQPSLFLRFEIGNDVKSNRGKVKEYYTGITQDMGLSLFKRYSKGNAFFLSLDMFSYSYVTTNNYMFSMGYVLPL